MRQRYNEDGTAIYYADTSTGLTLGVFLVLSAIFLFFVVVADTDHAEAKAEMWAARYFPDAVLVVPPTCEQFDTDKNGRVRCSMSLRQINGITVVPATECPMRSMSCATDCQYAK